MKIKSSKFPTPLSISGKRLGAGATALLAAMGLGMVTSTAALGASCENPDSLTFAMIPTEESVAELELYKPVTDRMAKLTGKKIEFFMPTSYASVVEGLLSEFVDVAVLPFDDNHMNALFLLTLLYSRLMPFRINSLNVPMPISR